MSRGRILEEIDKTDIRQQTLLTHFSSMMKKCGVHTVGFIILFIGGINWGLVGAFQYNLVGELLGTWPTVVRIVYVLVGLSAIFALMEGKCKACKMTMSK